MWEGERVSQGGSAVTVIIRKLWEAVGSVSRLRELSWDDHRFNGYCGTITLAFLQVAT